METQTARLRNISIIKVENGYLVTAVGKTHVAKDEEEVKELLLDKLPDVIEALEQAEEIQPQRPDIHPGIRPQPKMVEA